MRVLIISTNRENLPDPVAPLGAAYVATAVKQAGHEVRLLDLQFVVDVPVALKDACRIFRPQVVGLSIRNVDNVSFPHSVSYMPDIDSIVRVLKRLGIKIIVAGGSGFTIMAPELMKALDINLGIVGEGEEAFPELLRRVEEMLPVQDVPGLAYTYKGRVHINPTKKIANLNTSPEPDRGFIENALYLSEGGAGNIQTKRGCAFACAYCTYPLIEGRKVRLRLPKNAADEFEAAVKFHGLKHMFIVDNVFNYPIDHAKEFCRELIARRMDTGWSCYLNPAFVDAELIDLMVKAGCKGVEFGTDSAVDEILAGLKKGFKAQDVVKASEICGKGGVPFCHSLLMGAPGETIETVSRTLEAIDAQRPNAVIAMLGVRVFPGTELAKRAMAEGVFKDSPIGLKPAFYFSPSLDMDAVSGVLGKYGRDHTNFIMPGIHLRMNDKIRQRLRAYGFLGPLWEYLRS